MERLSNNEFEIMSVLWSAGRPLSRADIISSSPNRSWKEKSIHILLNSLLAKGMVEVSGFASSRTNVGRVFSPCCTQEEYISFMLQVGGKTLKVDAAKLFSALHARGELDESSLEELEKIVRELREAGAE